MGSNRRNFLNSVFLNWPWDQQDFDDWQTYYLNQYKNRALAYFTEGVLLGGNVTESAPPAMTVDVSACKGVHGDGLFINAIAHPDLAIAAADPTNPRIDLVCAKVEEVEINPLTNPNTGVNDNTEIEEQSSFFVVTGTPAASPTPPTGSVPANAIILAQVTVPASDTSIEQSQIDETIEEYGGLRQIATFRGQTIAPNRGVLVGRLEYVDASHVQMAPGIAGVVEVEIDGVLLSSSSALSFELGDSGVGASDLDTGNEAVDTAYYCYFYNSGGSIAKKLSATPPDDIGDTKPGYHPTNTTWRCVGMLWNNSNEDIEPFECSNGRTKLRDHWGWHEYDLVTGSSDQNWATTSMDMPKTSPRVFGEHYASLRRMWALLGASDATANPTGDDPLYSDLPNDVESALVGDGSDIYSEQTKHCEIRIADRTDPKIASAIVTRTTGLRNVDDHQFILQGWEDPWAPK